MSDKKEIVIKDACILFDLVDLNLLEGFFQLEVEAYTTPQVISEILFEEQWDAISIFIDDGKLIVDNEGTFEDIERLFTEHQGLSEPDCSVLELALRKDAIIYSSDGKLRKISVQKKLIVRGVLWVIEELLNQEIIGREDALEKLKLYETMNQRAPIKEINILIEKITKM